LAQVVALRRQVFATVLLLGVLASLAAVGVTRWLTRRLAVLAADAQAVRQGRKAGIEVPRGEDEVSRIGATMSELIGHLQHEKGALARLNAELDARVAERTSRIERMAEESRHAAVTRERLRLARDLHDTLAHSLMALLTQIRLVRKLRDRMSPEELGSELGRAEEVAASGLSEARAAITQMRHGSVRESGLVAALRELLTRFGERTGLAATLRTEGAAADLADERAETLYRIVEEALRNVERHAQAHVVEVSISEPAGGDPAGPRAALAIRDDGVGFDPAFACPGHYGMLGMREQAALIGASLSVVSRAGAGTEVRLEFAA
jgi:signal transduction histidine kinase